MSYRGFWL